MHDFVAKEDFVEPKEASITVILMLLKSQFLINALGINTNDGNIKQYNNNIKDYSKRLLDDSKKYQC